MAPISLSDSQRGRRLLATVIAVVAVLAALSILLGVTTPARADNGPGNGNSPLKARTPTPSLHTPSPIPTCGGDFDPCPTVSPSVVVVSPVAPDPTPSTATPSYLIGTAPSPTPNLDGTTTVSSPVPLAGGFVDQLPTPSDQATAATASDLAPRQGGVPLPFLAVGALLILGAVGSLIYAIAPRQKNVFAREHPAGQPPVFFMPYGPDAPGTNLLSGGPTPRPGPQKPA